MLAPLYILLELLPSKQYPKLPILKKLIRAAWYWIQSLCSWQLIHVSSLECKVLLLFNLFMRNVPKNPFPTLVLGLSWRSGSMLHCYNTEIVTKWAWAGGTIPCWCCATPFRSSSNIHWCPINNQFSSGELSSKALVSNYYIDKKKHR